MYIYIYVYIYIYNMCIYICIYTYIYIIIHDVKLATKQERSQVPSCSRRRPGLSRCWSKVSGQTFAAWVARHTAPSRPCQQSCWLLSSGGYLEFLPVSFSFGLSGLPFKPHLLSHLWCGHLHHQVHDTRHLPGIWMSSGPTTKAY